MIWLKTYIISGNWKTHSLPLSVINYNKPIENLKGIYTSLRIYLYLLFLQKKRKKKIYLFRLKKGWIELENSGKKSGSFSLFGSHGGWRIKSRFGCFLPGPHIHVMGKKRKRKVCQWMKIMFLLVSFPCAIINSIHNDSTLSSSFIF